MKQSLPENLKSNKLFILLLLMIILPFLSSCLVEPSLKTLPYKGMAFGKVTDEKGNAIEGAKIRVPGSDLTVNTNSKGQFTIVNLPLGKSIILVEHSKYQSISKEINVDGKEVIRDFDFILKNYIYDVKTEQIGTGDVQISWKTTIDAKEKLYWGSTDSYGNKIIYDKFNKNHSKIVYSIEVDAEYHYKIYAKDLRGFEYETEDMTFKISPQDLPLSVTITKATAGNDTVKLEWTKSEESDFASYQIYRNSTVPVLQGGKYVVGITDKSITSFTDGGLVENNSYFYQVLVYNSKGIYSKSNEFETKTLNPPPKAVSLDPPYEISNNSMKLSWSQSNATDFYSYQVYKSEINPIPGNSEIIAEFKNNQTITYVVSDLKENTKYYFKVAVLDNSSQKTDSNTVGAYTQNLPPPIIFLGYDKNSLKPTSAVIGWTDPNISDFKKIDLYRSTDTPVSSSDTLVTTITQKDVLNYTDTSLESGKGYYYRAYLYDQTDLETASNETALTTPAVVPSVFTGGVISIDSYFSKSNSPYTVSGDVTVAQGTKLVVEDGVEIKISANNDDQSGNEDANKVEFIIKGTFISQGTESSRIKFYSASATPTAGDWYGFVFKDSTPSPDSVFEYMDIENADYGFYLDTYFVHVNYCSFNRNNYGVYLINSPQTVIRNSIFNDNQLNGIYCENNSNFMVQKSVISTNSDHGIYIKQSNPLILQSVITLNQKDGIYCTNSSNPFIQSNNIMTNSSWAVEGGGILGSEGGTNGNYISGNNGVNTLDSQTGGVQDGYLNTTTTQNSNVDAINDAKTSPIQ